MNDPIFSHAQITVYRDAVVYKGNRFAMANLAPVRSLYRIPGNRVAFDLVLKNGQPLDRVPFQETDEYAAMTAIEAINREAARHTGDPVVTVAPAPPAQRDAFSWIMIGAGAIVVAAALIWVISAII